MGTGKISKYVRNRIDDQNMRVVTLLSFVIIIMEIAVLLWSFAYYNNSFSSLNSKQAAYILLIAASFFTAMMLTLIRNGESLSFEKRHRLINFSITVFSVVMMGFGLFASARDIADGHSAFVFIVSLFYVFGLTVLPLFVSLICIPAVFALFGVYLYFFIPRATGEPFMPAAADIINIILLAVIIMVISIMNARISIRRYETEEGYYNNVRILLEANPNAYSTIRINVTKDTIIDNISKGELSTYFEGVMDTAEISERIFSLSPSMRQDIALHESDSLRDHLLKCFEEGNFSFTRVWNFELSDGQYGWTKTYYQLMKDPATKDIEAIVYSERYDVGYAGQRLLSLISDQEYSQISLIDIKSKKVRLYSRKGIINKGDIPAIDYEEETKNIFSKVASDPSGESTRMGRLLSLDTILIMLSKKKVYTVSLEAGGRNYQETFRYLDDYKRTILMTLRDVTEVVREEEENSRRIKEALDQERESGRVRNEFLSGLSHDIRTQMNAVIGFSTILENEADDEEKVRANAGNIVTAGNQLLSLLNDALDLSKLEAGRTYLSEEEFMLRKLLSDVDAAMRPHADAKKQELRITLQQVAHENFIGDEGRVSQILSNVLSYAINHAGEGGHIDLVIKGMPHPSGMTETLSFEIKDDGPEISETFRNEIFLPFSRENNARLETVENTGLDMAITKELVTLMGGSIRLQSAPEEGNTFTVLLPLTFSDAGRYSDEMETADEEKDEEKEDEVFDGLKILAAEDNALNAELLSEIMKMKGASVDVEPNGEQVLNAFKYSPAGKHDVIFMDVEMPVMNGLEAARAIRALESDMSLTFEKRHEAAKIPIIAMTANAFTEDAEKAIRSGMNEFVAKPINLQVLSAAIKNCIDAEG